MASFYPNLSGEGDMLPPVYAASQPSVSLSYSNLLSVHEPESIETRDEVLFMPPPVDGNTDKGLMHSTDSGLNHQYHGLSLTLGSHDPSLVQLHSDLNQYSASSFAPLLSSQTNDLKNIHYLSFDLASQADDAVKFGAGNGFQSLISSKESSFMPSLHQGSEYAATLCDSRYVKAAQDLLNELVCMHTAPKLPEKVHNFNQNGSRDSNSAAEPQDSTKNASHDLSASQRFDLQNKVTKLLGMLDEVDRRYKQYGHQMQVVVSSFDMLAGCGAAQPYTALALRTISRQFRCLRDAIKKQIQAIQKSLGEQDVGPNGVGVLSRLRYVDQQLRQQKALQQFGVMRQPWRPQRGLPETAVSVLRAWLFEHFLHPYPKDSEKLVLARQTGLTRSQVANWFINARVRLWKPMIEEMYKEEFGDTETELKSSPDHAMPAQETSVFDDRDEEFQGSLVSAVTDGNHHVQSRAEFSRENRAFQGNEVNFGLMHMQPSNQTINMAGNRLFTHNHTPLNTLADGASGDRVSLALGLQQDEKAQKLTPDETQLKGNEGSPSSMALDKLEYYYADPVNNQHRFANTHLLSDFVA